jgi:hypothetical protein
MLPSLRWLVSFGVALFLFSFASSQEGKKYSVQTAATPIPKELSMPIQKLLADGSVQLLDPAGKVICDVWLRKDLPADATPEQIKTGVTYREVKQSEILGAIQFHRDWTDYRKQKIKAGVYTMRLGFQPADGKHTSDISDFQDFAIVTGVKNDTRTTLMETKAMIETSGDSLGLGHPGVFMLWPYAKPGKEPDLAARPKNHWVLQSKTNLVVGGKAGGVLGIGLTLVGHSPAE